MEKSPMGAWLDMCMLPFQFQAAIMSGILETTIQTSSVLTMGTSRRRRSTAHLTLAASNNWVLPIRSKAKLSVVTN